MKKFFTIIVAVLAGGLLVCSCGYGGEGLDGGMDGRDGNGGGDQAGNECAQANGIVMQGVTDACANLGNFCCFCKCWNDGRKTYDFQAYASDQTCLCEVSQTNPPPCEGETLTQALACLADETACRQQAMDMITNAETGACTLTPL
jgi:hypothetical protein